jgi:hypothetical protein
MAEIGWHGEKGGGKEQACVGLASDRTLPAANRPASAAPIQPTQKKQRYHPAGQYLSKARPGSVPGYAVDTHDSGPVGPGGREDQIIC